jgi:hypothetical protein
VGAVLPKNNFKDISEVEKKSLNEKECYDSVFNMYEEKYRNEIIKHKKISNKPIKNKICSKGKHF